MFDYELLNDSNEELECMSMKHYAPNRCEPIGEKGGGGQGGCKPIFKVILKMQKSGGFGDRSGTGRGGGGVRRMNVNQELKLL